MSEINRQWIFTARPKGFVDSNTFSYHEAPLPTPDLDAGEVLVKTLYLSFDPAMRGWMDDKPSYLPPVELGTPMRASGIGQVAASEREDLPTGTLVMGFLNWQEYVVFDSNSAGSLNALAAGTPPDMALSAFGGTSMTAYFGLFDVGQPKAGETVLVSGAAGATGSVVCQLAKLKGCRVIGIAGGPEKCDWLKTECGVDEVIDYRNEDLNERLAAIAPMSIDLFFDNVGGDTLEAAIEQMADHGRIVLCGAIAGYNASEPLPGPRNMMNLIARRIRMQGFIMLDYLHRIEEFQAEFGTWVLEGKIKTREDVQEGFENIPATLNRLFEGRNQGKQLLKLADPV
ncbi:MAG: NADP-dependent oxidoreductase [Spongiibacteraceae bacterium]|jgi:NADPH-dependent curcumin reductase|nr:NADP-dependent oxidoreductase [Spongiibacteraceae bacterium]